MVCIWLPHPYIGATADNFLKCNCCPKSCIKYKCPYAIHNEKLTESWQKCELLEQVSVKIQLKCNHRHYSQIIGQMTITGHHNTCFVVLTSKDILFDCVKFDESYWQKILPNLIVFFKMYIQKYLLGITQMFICPMCKKRELKWIWNWWKK